MHHRKLLSAALAALLLLPFAASAQALKAGKWTGTATPPGEQEVALTFDVKVAGDTISIMLNAGEHGSWKLEEIKLAGDKLTFSFTPGPKVNCTLTKGEDAAFAGTCVGDDGESVPMKMIPPKQGPPASFD